MAWMIRDARAEDLATIVAIEEMCFADPWDMAMIRKEFGHEWSSFLVLERRDPLGVEEDDIVGFCLYWSVVDELHLMQIAVRPEWRGQGLGHRLMAAMIAAGRAQEAVRILLEVRASNAAALGLYDKLGFAQIGVRRGYYSDPREDALVLACELPQGPALRP